MCSVAGIAISPWRAGSFRDPPSLRGVEPSWAREASGAHCVRHSHPGASAGRCVATALIDRGHLVVPGGDQQRLTNSDRRLCAALLCIECRGESGAERHLGGSISRRRIGRGTRPSARSPRLGEPMATIDQDQVPTQRLRPCPQCGQVSADARYCPGCGHALGAATTNGEAPTVEQPSVLPPPIAYPPPPSPPAVAPAALAGPAQPSRRRLGAIAGVLVLAIVIGAVVAIVMTNGSGSGPDPNTVYRHKLTAVFAPVIAANTTLSNTLQALHGSSTSAATSAANQAQQAAVSARGAMSVLTAPSGSQQLSQQAQQAITQESGYLGTVAATLSSPSPGEHRPAATTRDKSAERVRSARGHSLRKRLEHQRHLRA